MSALHRSTCVLLLACGGTELAVPRFPQPESAAPLQVGYPPPPAQVQHLAPVPPAPGCFWLDGQWSWVARGWDWIPGGWIRPPAGCRYSSPALQWVTRGGRDLLYYWPGRWYSESDAKLCAEPERCPTGLTPFAPDSSNPT